MVRYYCIDFETNGFPPKGAAMCHELPLPFSSMPIQVSVDIVDSSGVVEHAYDAIILGATRLCPWVVQNVPIPMSAVLNGKPLAKVVDELGALLRPEDVIVAHNVAFDMDLALARTCERMDIASTTLRRKCRLRGRQRWPLPTALRLLNICQWRLLAVMCNDHSAQMQCKKCYA